MILVNTQLPADFPQFSKGSPPYRQKFPFPCTMMSHIALNVTSRPVYQKLAQTCKYFYSKNPVVGVRQLYIYSQNAEIKDFFEFHNLDPKSLKEFPSKFWFGWGLWISSLDAIDFAILNSKIYQFTLGELDIKNVKIEYSELALLSTKGTFSKVNLYQCDIVHDSPIDISDVVKLFAGAKVLKLKCTPTVAFTSETVRKLMDIPAFPNLDELMFVNVPEALDINELIKFMNKHFKFWIYLAFSRNVSENYKKLIVDSKQKLYETQIYVHV